MKWQQSSARATAVVALLLLAACGGGDKSRDDDPAKGSTDSTDTSAPAGGEAQGDAKPGEGGGKTTDSSAPPAGGGAGSATTAPGSPPGGGGGSTATTAKVIHITATLNRTCFHHGEEIKLTVRSQPSSAIIYDTYYSDGKSNFSTGGGYGEGNGNGRGKADATGLFERSWVTAPNVPTGDARVEVHATWGNDLETVPVFFTIKPATEPCP